MAIFLPQRWRQQPQGLVEIDKSNALANGIAFAWDESHGGQDFVSKTNASVSSSGTKSIGPDGIQRTFDGTQSDLTYAWASGFNPFGGATEVTFEALISVSANDASILAQWSATSTNNSFLFSVGPSGEIISGVVSATTVSSAYKTSETLSFNRFYYITSTWKATATWGFYIDARPVTSTAVLTGAPASVRASANARCQLGRKGDGSALNGSIVFVRGLRRARSAAEVIQLAENPWQIYRPIRSIIYSFPSSATIPTLSNATVTDIGTYTARPRVTVTF